MFAPAIPQVMQEFGSSNDTLGILAVSIYVLGYAFGPLILAPLSEMYGRLALYHSTTIVFILMNVACARSTNMPMLVVFRFLAGLIGSCPLTLGPGSIADCFRQEERGFVIAIWTLPILLGPAVGPVAGGYITDYLGWRADFWFLVIAVRKPSLRFELVLTNERVAGCRLDCVLDRPARVLSSSTSSTPDRSPAQRNRQHNSTIRTTNDKDAARVSPHVHYTPHQDASPVSRCLHPRFIHSCQLRVSVSALYYHHKSFPGAIRLQCQLCRSDLPWGRSRAGARPSRIRICL